LRLGENCRLNEEAYLSQRRKVAPLNFQRPGIRAINTARHDSIFRPVNTREARKIVASREIFSPSVN
jgi:hypothetical protein